MYRAGTGRIHLFVAAKRSLGEIDKRTQILLREQSMSRENIGTEIFKSLPIIQNPMNKKYIDYQNIGFQNWCVKHLVVIITVPVMQEVTMAMVQILFCAS